MSYKFEEVIRGKKVVISQETETPVDISLLEKQINMNGSLNYASVNQLMNFNSDYKHVIPDNPYLIIRISEENKRKKAEIYAGKNEKSVNQLPGFYVVEKQEDIDVDKELARAADFIRDNYVKPIISFKKIEFRNYEPLDIEIKNIKSKTAAGKEVSAKADIIAHVMKREPKKYKTYLEIWKNEVEPYLICSNPKNRWRASKALTAFKEMMSKDIYGLFEISKEKAYLALASAHALIHMISQNKYQKDVAEYKIGESPVIMITDDSIKRANVKSVAMEHPEQRIFTSLNEVLKMTDKNSLSSTHKLNLEVMLRLK